MGAEYEPQTKRCRGNSSVKAVVMLNRFPFTESLLYSSTQEHHAVTIFLICTLKHHYINNLLGFMGKVKNLSLFRKKKRCAHTKRRAQIARLNQQRESLTQYVHLHGSLRPSALVTSHGKVRVSCNLCCVTQSQWLYIKSLQTCPHYLLSLIDLNLVHYITQCSNQNLNTPMHHICANTIHF